MGTACCSYGPKDANHQDFENGNKTIVKGSAKLYVLTDPEAQQKAIALRPNDADGIAGLGGILAWAGRPEETVGLAKRAMRLNPKYPTEYLWNLGHAYYLMGRYEEAIKTLNKLN